MPELYHITEHILEKDDLLSNVLVMNYHNGTVSSHGMSYKYLTCIREGFRGYHDNPVIDLWEEMSYANLFKEIHKINNSKYIVIDESNKEEFPKLFHKAETCGAKKLMACPVRGFKDRPVGMLIGLYKDDCPDFSDPIKRMTVETVCQKLGHLLDVEGK